jgi:hypothetical protein
MTMTQEQKDRLQILHDRAVKSAIKWWGETPGTETRRKLEITLDNREDDFRRYLESLTSDQ